MNSVDNGRELYIKKNGIQVSVILTQDADDLANILPHQCLPFSTDEEQALHEIVRTRIGNTLNADHFRGKVLS